jgi:hypothetical protein
MKTGSDRFESKGEDTGEQKVEIRIRLVSILAILHMKRGLVSI